MIVQFIDTAIGTHVYINPDYVVSLRPDPADPDHVSLIMLRNGESIRVKGDHREIAASSRTLIRSLLPALCSHSRRRALKQTGWML